MTAKKQATRWEGPDDLRAFLVPIDNLTLDTRNPRQGDVKRIAESLARFGQRRLAVVNAADGNLIEAGNHMTIAARELGWTHVAVIGMDDDPQTASAYGIAENRTSDLANYDDDLLAEVIGELDDLTGTGWTDDEAAALDPADPERGGVPTELTPFDRAHVLVTCDLENIPAVVTAVEQVDPDAEIRTGLT